MTDLSTIEQVDVGGKNVLVCGDFNVDDDRNPRASAIREIVEYLHKNSAAKIKVIGHTETDYDLAGKLKSEFPNVEFDSGLRKNPGEKTNDWGFAKSLAEGWSVFVNERFSVSHRNHASIVNLPKVIKQNGGEVCIGPRFAAEIENLSKVIDNPNPSTSSGRRTPVIMVISGVKEDKLSYVESFAKFADKMLIGGRLPEFIHNTKYIIHNTKVVVADLIADKEDITIHSIEKFEKEIAEAGTIVVSGPLGKFEDPGHRQGTDRVFRAVVNNKNAFKVAGGGDTEQAIKILGMEDEWDWVSVGGGAMLEFLAKGTLPGIEALLD